MRIALLLALSLPAAAAVDADGDGYDARVDCDDTNPDVNPGAAEVPGNGIDDNCDGLYDCYADEDGDGYGQDGVYWTWEIGVAAPTCTGRYGAAVGGDCDDGDKAVNPGATEIWYDGVDQDCSGTSDYDADGDGYDSASYGGDDCDDADPAIHPGATEIWYDGVDQDCDGNDDDQDRDGVPVGEDCIDTDPDVQVCEQRVGGGRACSTGIGTGAWPLNPPLLREEAPSRGGAGARASDPSARLCLAARASRRSLRSSARLCLAARASRRSLRSSARLCLAARASRRFSPFLRSAPPRCARLAAISPFLRSAPPRCARLAALAGGALLVLWALLFARTAAAQEGLDGHGVVAVASDGDAGDLLLTWRAERQVPRSFGLEALFEYARSPLVLSTLHDGVLADRRALVDDLLVLNLTGGVALGERLSIGAAYPLYLASQAEKGMLGPASGDLRLSVAGGVILPDHDGTGPGLSVLPFLDLPTGTPARNLGSGGFGGGAIVPVGYAGGRLAVTGNLGLVLRKHLDVLNLKGGPRLITGLGASWRFTDALALRAEVHLEPSLTVRTDGWAESPGEALLSLRYRHGAGPLVTVGAATAITPGTGAALYRFFLGAGYARKAPSDDPDRDGLRGRDDACPTRAEVINGWRDEDGCPDQLADLVVEVRDTEGVAFPDLALLDGATVLGRTDSRGVLRLDGLEPGRAISLVPEEFHTEEIAPVPITLEEGENRKDLVLTWLPGRVTVVTRSTSGPITNAEAGFSGPTKIPGGPVTGGRRRFFLSPGDWHIVVSAPIFVTETRDLTIGPDETAEVVIEVVLQPDEFAGTWLRAVVRDTDGRPVPEVSLTAGNQLLGVTDVNGEVRVGGLKADAKLRLVAEHFFLKPLPPVNLVLARGRNDLVLDVEWLPGRVDVVTRSAQGPVTTAEASFSGPKKAPGGPITGGERLFYLGPGAWELYVTAPVFDRERRYFVIQPDQTSVVVVEVSLRPETVREDQKAIVTLAGIQFDFDRSTIRPESYPVLHQMAVVLEARPDIARIEVQGHTDDEGSAAYNLALSQERVEAVVDFLVELGVDRSRLVAKGYGESQPVASNATEEGREQNRRVEFVILDR